MNSQMTPCERLGYKVGDRFKITGGEYLGWDLGSIVELISDDGTICPEFTGISHKNARYEDNKMYLYVTGTEGVNVTKISKLKPAKQALADAIHLNVGWDKGFDWNFSTCDRFGVISFWDEKPVMSNHHSLRDWCGESRLNLALINVLPNWHQCILSRDEYFTAHPEQVKVKVNNKTEHKVEVEMKSESEMTIKVGDWHKNGELPPVGEVCEWVGNWGDGEYRDCLDSGVVAEILAHYQPLKDGNFVAVFAYETKEPIGMLTDQSIAKCFRPLRTERDKAIDEMVDCLAGRWANCEEIAAHLYENGYRKEVK